MSPSSMPPATGISSRTGSLEHLRYEYTNSEHLLHLTIHRLIAVYSSSPQVPENSKPVYPRTARPESTLFWLTLCVSSSWSWLSTRWTQPSLPALQPGQVRGNPKGSLRLYQEGRLQPSDCSFRPHLRMARRQHVEDQRQHVLVQGMACREEGRQGQWHHPPWGSWLKSFLPQDPPTGQSGCHSR